MPPEDPKDEEIDTAENEARNKQRLQQRKAIHKRLKEKGQTRTAFLRVKDYVEYDTQVWNMQGDGFPIFWLTDVYGGELLEPFTRYTDQEHLWRATIVRRDAGYNEPELAEAVIYIDLDQCKYVIRVPSAVWQYAFEKHRGQHRLDLNPFTERWIDVDEVVAGTKEWYPPKTTVQVILASARAGMLVKGPMTLLLLLAQDKIPLDKLQWADLDDFAGEWDKVWSLRSDCTTALEKQEKGPDKVDVLDISLEFPKDRIKDLMQAIVAGTSQPLRWFVNDVWLLQAGENAPGEEEAIVAEALVEESAFSEGDPYYWFLIYAAFWERRLHRSWQDTPRIARCENLGEKYYLNTEYASWARSPEMSWEQNEKMTFLKPRRTHVHPIAFGAGGEPYILRAILEPEVSADRAKSEAFSRFFSDIFARVLDLVEHREGYSLFRDTEAVDVEGEPEILRTDLVVKDIAMPAQVKPYCGGLQAYLDLFSLNGYPLRWFTLYPWQECVEREASVLRTLLHGWFGDAAPRVDQVARSLIRVREESLLDVDLDLGDLLANAIMQEYVQTPEATRSVVNVWKYDPAAGKYVPVLDSPQEVSEAKDLLEKVQSGEYKEMHPFLWCAEMYAFQKDHPEEFKRLAEQVSQLAGDTGVSDHEPEGMEDPEAELLEARRKAAREITVDEDEDDEDDDFDWDAWWEDPFGDAWLSDDPKPGEETASWPPETDTEPQDESDNSQGGDDNSE